MLRGIDVLANAFRHPWDFARTVVSERVTDTTTHLVWPHGRGTTNSASAATDDSTLFPCSTSHVYVRMPKKCQIQAFILSSLRSCALTTWINTRNVRVCEYASILVHRRRCSNSVLQSPETGRVLYKGDMKISGAGLFSCSAELRSAQPYLN